MKSKWVRTKEIFWRKCSDLLNGKEFSLVLIISNFDDKKNVKWSMLRIQNNLTRMCYPNSNPLYPWNNASIFSDYDSKVFYHSISEVLLQSPRSCKYLKTNFIKILFLKMQKEIKAFRRQAHRSIYDIKKTRTWICSATAASPHCIRVQHS